MNDIFTKVQNSIKHLEILHHTFINEDNFQDDDVLSFQIYNNNLQKFNEIISGEGFIDQLYSLNGRQMILADLYEYIFLGRLCYSMGSRGSKENKVNFVRAILHFVNMLMCYETMTVSDLTRRQFIVELGDEIEEISDEVLYPELVDFLGKIGLPQSNSDARNELNRYFDKMLPKTAGGLWHELLVYIFLLRYDFGYIVPLLLSQRLFGLNDHIVPPDYLIITKDKRIYGIEVGIKKEIQSGSFSLKTAIPTATIDTINSRTSDRCPICLKWLNFCPFVIDKFSNFGYEIEKDELRCMEAECNYFDIEQIVAGDCQFTKYRRGKAKTLSHTHHDYNDGKHYHYQCVLSSVENGKQQEIITARDTVALKTHFPYYAGLEGLL